MGKQWDLLSRTLHPRLYHQGKLVSLWRSKAPRLYSHTSTSKPPKRKQIGTGPTLNEATDNAMLRAADVLHMTLAEVRNRCTITGGVEIGRLPG